MKKPVPKAIPSTFHFTSSDLKNFKLPTMLKHVKVRNWNNIPELVAITRNGRRRIAKEHQLNAWVSAFKTIKPTCCLGNLAIASFAAKMAAYLEDDMGQDEFITEMHKREMSMLEKRKQQIKQRIIMKMELEQLQAIEKECDQKIKQNLSEDIQLEVATDDDDDDECLSEFN